MERYTKQRDAIIDALIDKEVAAIVEQYGLSTFLCPPGVANHAHAVFFSHIRHDKEKQAILAQIRVKSIQM